MAAYKNMYTSMHACTILPVHITYVCLLYMHVCVYSRWVFS